MSIRAVLFDLHQTLIYPEVFVSDEEISEYLRGKDYEVSPQQLRAARAFTAFVDYPKHGHKDWRSYLRNVLWRLEMELDEQTLKGLIDLMEGTKLSLYPEAGEALRTAKELGLKTAIVTTIAHFMFRRAIQPLQEQLDYVMTGYEAGCDKSDPRMYASLLRILDVKPEETVVIGDDIQLDVLLPKKLGLKTILLDRQGGEQTATAPDAVAGSLTEAMDLVQNLWSPQ